MDVFEAVGFIGGLAGIIAIATVVYKVGFAFGSLRTEIPKMAEQIENQRKKLASMEKHCAEVHGGLNVKVDIIWNTLLSESLIQARRHHLKTENPSNEINDLVDRAITSETLKKLSKSSDAELSIFAAQNLQTQISELALKKRMGYLEALGLTIVRLKEKVAEC